MDVEARQLALTQLQRAKQGDSQSRQLLKQAQQANAEFIKNPSNAAEARRAVLARRAYDSRVSAEVGRVRAAFALMAADEGTQAISARQAEQRATDSRQKAVFIEKAKGASLRRGIMLQAQDAAEKAFEAAPGLPHTEAEMKASAPQQATVGLTENFRPPSYLKNVGTFFPSDVRAAASSFKGLSNAPNANWSESSPLGWLGAVEQSIEEAAAAVQARGVELAKEVAAQEPGAANLADKATGIIAQLKQRHEAEMTPAGMPWLHIIGGGLAALLIMKVLK